jgi:hypothetical protein
MIHNEIEKIKIYCLTDPRNGYIKYIGMTSKDLKQRIRKHLNCKRNFKKIKWIKELKYLGLKPIIEQIDTVDFEDWQYWESWYIELFRYYGFELLNLTSGGEGTFGYKHTEETREIIKEKRKKQIFSEETKKILSEVRMGNTYAKGSRHTEEMRLEKSIRQRGKFGGTILRRDLNGEVIEYQSIMEAGDSVGTSYKNIWYACTKRNGKLYKGFFWEYKSNRQKKNEDNISYEYLYENYINKRISGKKIADNLNCSENKIYRLLKEYNLLRN